MSGEDHADTSSHLPLAVRKPDPVVRAVTVGEIIEALADGLRDFQSAPIYGLTFGALYAASDTAIPVCSSLHFQPPRRASQSSPAAML